MKRRIRLMSAILSLAASMAVLVFGVYAATSKTVGMTASISFTTSTARASVTITHAVPQTATIAIDAAALKADGITIDGTAGNTMTVAQLNAAGNRAVVVPIHAYTEAGTLYYSAIQVSVKNEYSSNVNITVSAPTAVAVQSAAVTHAGTGGITVTRLSNTGTTGVTLSGETLTITPGNTGKFLYVFQLIPASAKEFTSKSITIGNFVISN